MNILDKTTRFFVPCCFLFGLFLGQGQTATECYDADNAGKVGESGWTGCADMYIVKNLDELKDAVKTNYTITHTSDDGIQIIKLEEPVAANAEYFSGQQVVLYPNPVTHTLYIQSPRASELRCWVYDLTGKALSAHHQTGQTHRIDLSALVKGVYLLKVSHKNSSAVYRFVKS